MSGRIFRDFGIGRIYGIGDALTFSKYPTLVSEVDYPKYIGY